MVVDVEGDVVGSVEVEVVGDSEDVGISVAFCQSTSGPSPFCLISVR